MKNSGTHRNSKQQGLNPVPWIAGALFVVGMAVLAGLYWNKTVVIRDIRIENTYFTEPEEVRQHAVSAIDMHPDSVNTMEIIRRLELVPYIKRAGLRVEPNGTMTVKVEEREPIALLTEAGNKIYVDKDGIRLELRPGKTVDVPILYGFSATPMNDTLKSGAWQKTRDFLVEVREKPISNATISEVAWTDEADGIVALSHENGVKLVFGMGDFDSRLANWEAFYTKVIRKKGINAMRTVDLRFKGQVVTKEI